ncbi:MAG: PAS domain-containing protein, partial [Sedimentisphaerales bacterium]
PEVVCFSEKIKELSGYDADEILADRDHWGNLIHPDDRQKVFAAYAECKNWGVSFEIEYRIIHKDGSLRCVTDKGQPVFNDRGDIIHVEGAIVPISQNATALSNDNLCVLRKV